MTYRMELLIISVKAPVSEEEGALWSTLGATHYEGIASARKRDRWDIEGRLGLGNSMCSLP